MVINRAKFDACTISSFREVKTDKHTDRQNCPLYIRLQEKEKGKFLFKNNRLKEGSLAHCTVFNNFKSKNVNDI